MTEQTLPIEQSLVLASEDFDKQEFRRLHRFSRNDERVIAKLIAHGPVLLQGGRGSGKSAFLKEASYRLGLESNTPALGIYISLRHMPLLTSVGNEYQRILCELTIDQVKRSLADSSYVFDASPTLSSLQARLSDLSHTLHRRLVIMFDDAAHIGREASLGDFFDIFRTLSSSTISCKATIYPGVTNFGKRFDVHNDATVIDVIRDEEQAGFGDFFSDVLIARFPELESRLSSELTREALAFFAGKSVLGNMRSFLFLCNRIQDRDEGVIGFSTVGESFLSMASEFYWPLLEEVKPKLGKYEPIADVSVKIAELLLAEAARSAEGTQKYPNPSVIIHRDIVSRLSKAFEILEYVGFISRREASRAMKSGGRGPRFTLNLCMLLETIHGSRLTSDLFRRWSSNNPEALQLHSSSAAFQNIEMPPTSEAEDLEILQNPVRVLKKSPAYPYGLSDWMIEKVLEAGINTVRELYEAEDSELDAIPQVGEARVRIFKNAVAQAVWL